MREARRAMKADYSRASFREVVAPRDQKCSCLCGENIKRKSPCFERAYVVRGKVTGHTRIVNMDHYDDWIDNVGHSYAQRIVRRHPELAAYFEGANH